MRRLSVSPPVLKGMRWSNKYEWLENIQLHLGLLVSLLTGRIGHLNSALSKPGCYLEDTVTDWGRVYAGVVGEDLRRTA